MIEKQFEIQNPNKAIVDPKAFDSKGSQLAESLSNFFSGLGDLGQTVTSIQNQEAKANLSFAKEQYNLKIKSQKEYEDTLEDIGAENFAEIYGEQLSKGIDILEGINIYEDIPEEWKKLPKEEQEASWEAYQKGLGARTLTKAKLEVDRRLAAYQQKLVKDGLEWGYLNADKKNSVDVMMTNIMAEAFHNGSHTSHLTLVVNPLSTYINEKRRVALAEYNDATLDNIKEEDTTSWLQNNRTLDKIIFNYNAEQVKVNENFEPATDPTTKANNIALQLASENNAIIKNSTTIYGTTNKDAEQITGWLDYQIKETIPGWFRNPKLTPEEIDGKMDMLEDVVIELGNQMTNEDKQRYDVLYPLEEKLGEMLTAYEEGRGARQAEGINNLVSNYNNYMNNDNKTGIMDYVIAYNEELGEVEGSDATTLEGIAVKFEAAKQEALDDLFQKSLIERKMGNRRDENYLQDLEYQRKAIEKLKLQGMPSATSQPLLLKAREFRRAGNNDSLVALITNNPYGFSIADRKSFLENPSTLAKDISAIRSYVRKAISIKGSSSLGVVGVPTEMSLTLGKEGEKVMALLEEAFLLNPTDFAGEHGFKTWSDIIDNKVSPVNGLFMLFKEWEGEQPFKEFEQAFRDAITVNMED